MKLVWHQFRKDARQFWVLLAVWFGLLLLNLAVNLDWVGTVAYRPKHGFDAASNVWTGALPGVIWFLAGLLSSIVVLTDSPARREGFLATRPMPKRDLLLAKILFVAAFIVAPWVLQEWIHLAGQRAPEWVITRGTLERLMFTLPLAFGCAAFATLWPNPARWARALGIIFACFILCAALVGICSYLFPAQLQIFESAKSDGVAYCYGVTLALMTLAIWHARAHRPAWARWSGLILAVIVGGVLASLWPAELFPFRPSNPALANLTVAQSGFIIHPRDISLWKVQDPNENTKPRVLVYIAPKTKPPPSLETVLWMGRNGKVSGENGSEVWGDVKRNPDVFQENEINRSDFKAWAAEFPPDILFRDRNSYSAVDGFRLGQFNLLGNPAKLNQHLILRADLEARVFQWNKIADLPVTAGAAATNEFGSWKLVAEEGAYQGGWKLFLERRQITLFSERDPRCSSVDEGPLAHMAWILYDEERHVAWVPDRYGRDSANRGTETAFSQFFLTLSFFFGDETTVPDLKKCRLIILEKSWMGSVPEKWESDPFTLAEKLRPLPSHDVQNRAPMEQAEFDRRFAALAAPSPDASRRAVSLYLIELLQLVESYNRDFKTNAAATMQLARYVPGHLDLMLDSLPALAFPSDSIVISAIEMGATEAQKPAIIAALGAEPDLARAVLTRHWLEDARPEIYHLAALPRPLPLPAMRAVAALKDPKTYPRLLEEFESGPNLEKDNILHNLPGMEPALDKIIARQFQEDNLMNWSVPDLMNDSFRLAMRHGQTNALHRLYQILNDPNMDLLNGGNSRGGVLFILETSMKIPANCTDVRETVAWLQKHRAEDFAFDPALRRFVLKQNP